MSADNKETSIRLGSVFHTIPQRKNIAPSHAWYSTCGGTSSCIRDGEKFPMAYVMKDLTISLRGQQATVTFELEDHGLGGGWNYPYSLLTNNNLIPDDIKAAIKEYLSGDESTPPAILADT